MVVINEGHINGLYNKDESLKHDYPTVSYASISQFFSSVLRRLQDFESPLITQENIGSFGVKVMLAKGYWNTGFDVELMRDPVGLELLYIQTLSEIEQGCLPVNDEIRNRLHESLGRGEKREVNNFVFENFSPLSNKSLADRSSAQVTFLQSTDY